MSALLYSYTPALLKRRPLDSREFDGSLNRVESPKKEKCKMGIANNH